MAATAHSDSYAIFMRKIGYSVGLEYTHERVSDLVRVYLDNRDVAVHIWSALEGTSKYWKRNPRSFEDFFFSLRLVQRTPGDILVLENLDAMAIASSLVDSGLEKERAVLFLMLWAILTNDGEIFVNLLLAEFEEEEIRRKLTTMVLQKREILGQRLRGKGSQSRINRTISIERQEKNKGSAGAKVSIVSIKRTEPLQLETAKRYETKDPSKIEFSDDYFRKVPPRRKDWARSLGLWDDAVGLTHQGTEFVSGLTDAGYISDQGIFTYWPMDYELVRSGFRPDLLGRDTRSLWQCLVDFGAAYGGMRVKAPVEDDADDAVKGLEEMINVFRTLHVRKAMLRRELPITVAYPVAVACACAERTGVIDLPAAIAREQTGERRRVALRRSRVSGGALRVRR